MININVTTNHSELPLNGRGLKVKIFVYQLRTEDFGNIKFTSEDGKFSLQFSYNDPNFLQVFVE
jgi:hypothetical protein